jgi:hypothetical protein
MVSKHYCRGELKSVSLFVKATPCHENKKMKRCPMHSSDSDQKKDNGNGCCDTENDLFKVENDQIETAISFDLTDYPVFFAVLSIIVPGLEINDEDNKTRHFFTYKPPLLVYDLPVSLQTFLC